MKDQDAFYKKTLIHDAKNTGCYPRRPIEVASGLKDLINQDQNMHCIHIYHNAEDAITFLPPTPLMCSL